MQSKTTGKTMTPITNLLFKFQKNHPPNKWFTKESVLLHYGENKIEIDTVDLQMCESKQKTMKQNSSFLVKNIMVLCTLQCNKKISRFHNTQSIQHALNSLCESA